MPRFTVYIHPRAWAELREAPGHVRHRLRRAIDGLAEEPHPYSSKSLRVPGCPEDARRLRIDRWRVVYWVDDLSRTVDVLAVRKRPPYDYRDLEFLIETVSP